MERVGGRAGGGAPGGPRAFLVLALSGRRHPVRVAACQRALTPSTVRPARPAAAGAARTPAALPRRRQGALDLLVRRGARPQRYSQPGAARHR